MVTIEVSERVWRHLTLQKNPGDSFNDVLERELGLDDETDAHAPAPEPDAASEPTSPYADVEFPSTVERRDAELAIDAAVAYLQSNGSASMREIVREVMPDHSLGYDVPELTPGERYRGAWWRKVVKPGLTAHPDVRKPKPGGSEWRWAGDEE